MMVLGRVTAEARRLRRHWLATTGWQIARGPLKGKMPTIDDVRAVKDVQGHVATVNGAVADPFGEQAVGVERLGLRLVHGQGEGEALPVQRRASDFVQAGLKRAVDVAVSAVVLVTTLPLIALVALAIVLDSRGPVFYRAERVGLRWTLPTPTVSTPGTGHWRNWR